MIKIEGNNNLVRDENTTAVINTDTQGLNRAKLLKNRIKTQDSEINTLRQEVKDMKDVLIQINERMKWQEQ